MTHYAHFYRATGGRWQVTITQSPALSAFVVCSFYVSGRREARKIAADFRAICWNF